MTPPPPDKPERRRTFSARFSDALSRVLVRLKVEDVPHIKRIIVTVAGGTILVLGVLLIVTPVPGALMAPVGLAILGTEYAWARRWLRNARKVAHTALSQTQRILSPRGGGDAGHSVHPAAADSPPEPTRKAAVNGGELRS